MTATRVLVGEGHGPGGGVSQTSSVGNDHDACRGKPASATAPAVAGTVVAQVLLGIEGSDLVEVDACCGSGAALLPVAATLCGHGGRLDPPACDVVWAER